MGWSSANPIFDETISVAIRLGVTGNVLTEIAEKLIWELQDGDWDTEDESVELFMDHPEIIQAFRNRGVRIPCTCTCCEHEPAEY
jgi:hypothetical protein